MGCDLHRQSGRCQPERLRQADVGGDGPRHRDPRHEGDGRDLCLAAPPERVRPFPPAHRHGFVN